MKKILLLILLAFSLNTSAQIDTNVLKLIETYDKALKTCHETSNNLVLSYENYIDSLETNCLNIEKVEALAQTYNFALSSCLEDYKQLNDTYFELDSIYQSKIQTTNKLMKQKEKVMKQKRWGAVFVSGAVGIVVGILIED